MVDHSTKVYPVVLFDMNGAETYQDFHTWIFEYCKHDYTWSLADGPDKPWWLCFEFENEDDALLFKLTWG